MKLLNYEVLAETGYKGFVLRQAPVKVLQFGEGNFLRAFADAFFDLANEKAGWNGKIAMVQPASKSTSGRDRINAQEGLYTLYLRGSENGVKTDRKRVISAADRCYNTWEDWDALRELFCSPDLSYVTSNTTEAGIVYDPKSTFSQVPSFSVSHTFRKISPHIIGQAMLVALKSRFSNGLKLGWAK